MRRIVVLAATAALALAGCGGDDSNGPAATATATEPPTTPGGETLAIAADPGGAKKFTKSSLTASTGTVTVQFSNDSQVPHAVAIEGNGVDVKGEVVTGEDAQPLIVDLKPGNYTFYCPVGDHREEGMEGKLVVK
jgi:plastocyanin